MFELYLLIFLLLLIGSIVISTLKIGISPMPSLRKVNEQIVQFVKNSEEETIIDLGSGFGTLAIYLASSFPNKKIIGYELSLIPFLVSQILKYILNLKNLTFYRKDFLHEDLSNKTLVCYLFPKGMEKLEDKLFDESINTMIVSSTFAFRNIKAREIKTANDIYRTPIYLYRT